MKPVTPMKLVTPVIPAKAGTQSSTLAGIQRVPIWTPAMNHNWVPAFAGMTGMTKAVHNLEETQMKQSIQFLMASAALATALSAQAQMTPVGKWHNIDDKTKEIKSEIHITEKDGRLNGVVAKLLRKDAKQDAVCDQCTDERKDKPILGMEIIRGAKKVEGKDLWEDGKIMDPENGKSYTLRLTPIEEGKKLEVRGSVFGIGRTQTWVRIP